LYGQFAYFDRQLGHPDWAGKRVLDFGGNVGNILLDPDCAIEHDKYWSIDVSRDAITDGEQRHPKAHFVFYDRYNFEYNPTGEPGLPIPDLGVRFDIIIGHSVLTHVPRTEALELTDQLVGFLADDGKAAFSYLDPWWTPPPDNADEFANQHARTRMSNLRYRLERHHEAIPNMDVAGLLALAERTGLTWTTLTNGMLFFDPDSELPGAAPSVLCDMLCTTAYMRQLFPNGRIVDPVPPVRMHCLILDRASAGNGSGSAR
jgi:SAM-dependent methyltransferase